MKKVKVLNRSTGGVVYSIPELNLRRSFAPKETKEIDVVELEKLTYIPGGQELLNHYLLIKDEEVAEEIVNTIIEPEYWMEEDNIKDIMLNGSLDEFLDCLDFATQGGIDIIKSLAVSLPLNDSAKRDAIKNKTGFDVDTALRHMREEREDNPVEESTGPQRRVAPKPRTPKYNVVK